MVQSSQLSKFSSSFIISNFSIILSNNIFFKFISWLRSNFCMAAAFVSVLVFGYDLVRSSVLDIFITYFTDEPTEYHLVKAAELATVLEGVSASLGIVVAYILDALFSNLTIISCSIASTIIGLVLFTLNLMIWRGRYEFVHIIGIFLLAMGKGVRPQLNVFLADQLRGHEPADTNTDKDPVKVRKRMWLIVAWLCSVAATFFISRFSWKTVLLSSTSVLVVTFIFFLCGIPFYHRKEFTGAGSLFNFIPVVKAFCLKKHLPYPLSSSSENYLYGPNIHDHQNQKHLSLQVKILRWLDKAAIIENSNLSSQEQKEIGRLCTVDQVKETKLLLKLIPMWSTFLVIGLVSSTGDTFSSEQGERDRLNDPIGFSFYIVFYLKHISKAMISYLFDKFLSPERIPKTQFKLAKILRIWIGMVLCTIFCAVAWRVEVGRLNNKITSMFWLAPQYCLFGLMLGFSADGLDEFIIDELPKSLQNSASAMNGFVIDGLGSFLSILFMYANRNLFGSTLKDSRLDIYYMRLMIISFLNVCYYYFISTIYYRPTLYPQAEMVERDIIISP